MKKPKEYKSLAPSLKGVLPADIVEKVYGETSNPDHWGLAFVLAEGLYFVLGEEKKRTLGADDFLDELQRVSRSLLRKESVL